MVTHIVIPSGDEDSIVGLQDEVVRNVVDDDRPVDVTTKQAQVFDQERPVLTRVLAVQAILDVVSDVDLIDDLVCVLLQGCSEDDNLVVLRHRFDELHAARSHKEETIVLVLNIVNKRLIEIKDQGVSPCILLI